MKKILIITTQIVVPPIDGGKQAIYHRADELSRYCDVSLVMLNNQNSTISYSELNKYFQRLKEIIILPKYNPDIKSISVCEKLNAINRWFFSLKPRWAKNMESDFYKKFITEYIIKNSINTVLLEMPFSFELLDVPLLKKNHIKIISILHNIEHLYFKDVTKIPELLLNYETSKIRKYEYNVVKNSDMAICISPWDSEFIKKELNIDNVKYLPSILKLPEERWQVNNKSEYINFCGALSFYPNLHGIEWFLEHIFTKYVLKYPNIKLKITGKISNDIKERLKKYNNIEFTGYISEEELKEVILNSKFAIIPILKGAGVKIKLLESLSYGVPTITTEHGYQGASFEKKGTKVDPYLVAKDTEEFLEHMIKITEHEYDNELIAKNARKYFKDTYASENNIKSWLDLIK